MKSATEMTLKEFTGKLAVSCIALLLCTAMICATIDPFSLCGIWSKSGWNEKKFSYFMRESLIKPYQIRKIKPDIVLLGNSVANTGFNMDDPFFSGQAVYSMGMAGMGVYGNYRILQNLEPGQKVIWLLDFWNFLGTNEGNSPSKIDGTDFGNRLAINSFGEKNIGQWWQMAHDTGLVLFSWDAVLESWRTMQQQDKQGWHLLRDGSWGGEPLHPGKSEQKSFQYMERIFLSDLKKSGYGPSIFSTGENLSSLQALELALRWIYDHGTDTIIIIPPSHARWYESIFVSNHWQHYQHWKKSIVTLNEKLANEYRSERVKIFDFSGYNVYTTEPVSEWKDKKSRIRYFSDGVHFSRELGSAMLENIKSGNNSAQWGRPLTSESVQIQLDQMKQQHFSYIEEQPEQWKNILQSCRTVYQQPDTCLDAAAQKARYGN